MGRARRMKWGGSWARVVGLFRRLMDGRSEEIPNWNQDSLDKALLMWPQARESSFFHLSRLYRYGFRLKVEAKGLSLSQFFADGEIYRPQAGPRKNNFLAIDLIGREKSTTPLRMGQCRMGRAKPVLEALGFPELDTNESYAVQFAGAGGETWIFIDTRPDLFRREVSAAVAAKLAKLDEGPSL